MEIKVYLISQHNYCVTVQFGKAEGSRECEKDFICAEMWGCGIFGYKACAYLQNLHIATLNGVVAVRP